MNATSPLVRASRPDDYPHVLALLEETFRDTWFPQLTAEAIDAYYRNRVAERYVAECGPQFLIAEYDGEVVGMARREGGFVDALHVSARARRRGVARQLMDALETGMREDGVAVASLETDTFNTSSQGLYLALGYRETARYPDTEWNSGLTTIHYEKPLQAAGLDVPARD